MSSINHRLWLKVSMSGGEWREESASSKKKAAADKPLSKDQMLKEILKASGGALGDLEGIMKKIVANAGDPGYWYVPLSGALPSYAFDGTYQKQTPEWGSGGRAMADIAGGLAKAAGGLAGEYLPGVGGGVRRLLTGVGDFLHSFTGDIDSPRIWMRSEFKTIGLGAKIAFENRAEFAYYRAAETWFTLMTVPVVDMSKAAQAITNKVVKTFKKYASAKGPLSQFEIVALKRPASGVSAFDVVVGEAEPLTEPGSALRLKARLGDAKALTLFSMDKANLASFTASYGGEQARGIDQDGVPRVVNFSFSFEPALVSSGINGLKRMFKQNSAAYSGRVTRGVTPEQYGAALADGEALPAVAQAVRKAAAQRRNDARLSLASQVGPLAKGKDAPAESFRLHTDAMARIILRKAGIGLAEAIMYHILNANVTAAAVEYMAGRLLRTVGPVRAMTSASGKTVLLPSGLPGFIYNTGRKMSNAIPGGM